MIGMYETFFHLKESPFKLTPDPHFFYLSRQHEEALAHLSYGVRERKGFMVITGEIGTGKTTLSRLFLNRLQGHTRTSLIFNPGLTPMELLRAINQDFGISCHGDSKKDLVDTLNDFLLKEISSGGNAVLLIDEAQNLSVEALEEIRLLSNLETEKEKLLQIVLMGQPELQMKLDLPELRQFHQRVALRFHLQPLDEQETEGYILYRLRMAGGPGEILFTREAYRRIYAFSRGFPRAINLICDQSLLAAYVGESGVITGPMVEKGIREISGNSPGRKKGRTLLRFFPWKADRQPSILRAILRPAIVVGTIAVSGLGLYYGSGSWKESGEDPALFLKRSGSPLVQTSPAMAGRQDPDGVFRVASPAESRTAAFLTLSRLWGTELAPPQEILRGNPGIKNPFSIWATYGFSTYIAPFDPALIRALDYPVLFSIRQKEGESRYVVVTGLNDREVLLSDPLYGKVIVPVTAFGKMVQGEGYILWKSARGLRFPLKTDDYDVTVETLQQFLQDKGYYRMTVDGLIGDRTWSAVSQYWRDKGISLKGAGPEIFMALSKQAMKARVPSLIE
jgi:general secretion pathway protein A